MAFAEAMADQRWNKSRGQTYDGAMAFVKPMLMGKGSEIMPILQVVALARQHQPEHFYFVLLVLTNILSSL